MKTDQKGLWDTLDDAEKPLEPVYQVTDKVGVDLRISDNLFQALAIPIGTVLTLILAGLIWGSKALCAAFLAGIILSAFVSGGVICIRRRRRRFAEAKDPPNRDT